VTLHDTLEALCRSTTVREAMTPVFVAGAGWSPENKYLPTIRRSSIYLL
jgi:hypothetical protein